MSADRSEHRKAAASVRSSVFPKVDQGTWTPRAYQARNCVHRVRAAAWLTQGALVGEMARFNCR